MTTYAAPDLTAQAEVTAYAGEPGLFKPGLPADPEAPHPGPWLEVTRYGDVQCFATWGSDEQARATGAPAAAQCQRGADGRTYGIRASGLGMEATAAALNEVVAHAQDQ